MITYDRRGFGRSAQPASGYDFDTFADDLAAVIAQTGVRDATLVGYSMGGGEVVRYFSRHNGRNVAKAGLVGAAAYYLLKTEDNPIGIDGAVFDGIKQGVQGDRKAYLGGLLKDVFLDAKRPATNPVTQEMVDAAARPCHAGERRGDGRLRRCLQQDRLPLRACLGQGADAGAARHRRHSGAVRAWARRPPQASPRRRRSSIRMARTASS